MVIGSDGLDLIDFDDYELARTIGIVALALILFEGGLIAGFEEIRPVLRPALALALVGTLVDRRDHRAWPRSGCSTWTRSRGCCSARSSRPPTAPPSSRCCAGRRCGASSPARSRARPGFNDPVAVLLVIGFIDWIQQPDYGIGDMALLLVLELGIGAVVGDRASAGWRCRGFSARGSTRRGCTRSPRSPRRRVAFGAADTLHGSGFLAVYVAGLVLGSARIPAKRTVTVFHQGLAWVAQIAMFLALGLLVFPSQLDEVAVEGTALALVLVFVARPLGDLRQHRVRPLLDAPSGWCSAGPGCAARCRWCSRRSR